MVDVVIKLYIYQQQKSLLRLRVRICVYIIGTCVSPRNSLAVLVRDH